MVYSLALYLNKIVMVYLIKIIEPYLNMMCESKPRHFKTKWVSKQFVWFILDCFGMAAEEGMKKIILYNWNNPFLDN